MTYDYVLKDIEQSELFKIQRGAERKLRRRLYFYVLYIWSVNILSSKNAVFISGLQARVSNVQTDSNNIMFWGWQEVCFELSQYLVKINTFSFQQTLQQLYNSCKNYSKICKFTQIPQILRHHNTALNYQDEGDKLLLICVDDFFFLAARENVHNKCVII